MDEYRCKSKRVVEGNTMDIIFDLGFNLYHTVCVRMAAIDISESKIYELGEKGLVVPVKVK